MKQNILFPYTEEYLPTPWCRNIETREVTASVCVNIEECSKEDTTLVMVVKKPHWEIREIRFFEGQLYRNVQKPSKDIVSIVNQKAESINWQNHIWSKRRATSRCFNKETDSEIVKNKVVERASELLIIDGMVFEKTTEPVYEIYFSPNKKGVGLNIKVIIPNDNRGDRLLPLFIFSGCSLISRSHPVEPFSFTGARGIYDVLLK